MSRHNVPLPPTGSWICANRLGQIRWNSGVRTCIDSSRGFNLRSNQKNLNVVSRLICIWKDRKCIFIWWLYGIRTGQKMTPSLILAPKQRSILNLLFRFSNLYDVPQVDAGSDQQSRAIRASWDLGISQLSGVLRNVFNKIYQRRGRAIFIKCLQQNILQD